MTPQLAAPTLGLRENLGQFALLVLVNAFVGGMVGIERSILPAIAEQEFHLAARAAMLSFIAAFGVAKALTNYAAGSLSDRIGRRHVLIGGWLLAIPVPFLLMWGPSWTWIVIANVLLGASQGLTWSTTVIMKIDLVGPRQRGLAMGLNEFAGYLAVGASALATGWIAATYGLRPQPFYLGVVFVALGLGLSVTLVRDTTAHASHESTLVDASPATAALSPREVFWRTTLEDRNLSSISQAGLVNNLNDGMAWGLMPIVFAAAGMTLRPDRMAGGDLSGDLGHRPVVHGCALRSNRPQPLVVSGMWTQAVGIVVIALRTTFAAFALGSVLLGAGHGDGVPDAARRGRRRRASVLARVGRRCVSLVARSRLRLRGAAGGHHCRSARPDRRGADHRGV